MDDCQSSHKICDDIDTLGLPRVPDIPQIAVCLNLPGTEGWKNHWAEFNKRVKEFHQSMINFNWKIMEWYALKSKQLERFGTTTTYIAGNLVTGPRETFIFTKTISDVDVITEIRKCLPRSIEEDMKYLERTGYKLLLTGKIFIFNDERVVAINYGDSNDNEKDTIQYKNCLKFSLYYKNERIDISESYNRVYSGLKYSFIIGGIGGLLTSYINGRFDIKPALYFTQQCCQSRKFSMYDSIFRFITSAACYTIVERVILFKRSQPERYILSGSAGIICGGFYGICDNCCPEKIFYGATGFGIFSSLCNLIMCKFLMFKTNKIGSSYENFASASTL